MVKTKQQKRPNKRSVIFGQGPTLPIANVTAVDATAPSTVKVTFDSPVQIQDTNLPQTWLFGTGNFHAVSITSFDAVSYTFVVNGTIAAAQDYVITPNDPAARIPGGGYVAGSAGAMT